MKTTRRDRFSCVVESPRLAFVIMATAASLATRSASAQLTPGTTESRPGTTPPLSSPNYSTTSPSYFTAGNQIDSTSFGFIGGPVGVNGTSTVFRNPDTGFLGFEYTFGAAGSGDSVTGVTLDDNSHPWEGIGITPAGADASGHTTAGSGSPSWTDGAPISFSRDTVANGQGITIRFLDAGEGTSVGGGDLSAEIFFDTTATAYESGSFTFLFNSGGNEVGSSAGFVPTPVPEPGASLLVIGGLVVLGSRMRAWVGRPDSRDS